MRTEDFGDSRSIDLALSNPTCYARDKRKFVELLLYV